MYWQIAGPPGQPQVANLDDDPLPEVFVARQDGILIYENDGTLKLGPVRLIDEATSPTCWSEPGAVHDFDGDGIMDVRVDVEVYEDAMHRWIPTRRIWNQHAYHVDNVREDGTIPMHMKKSWEHLNTFRTNAQINGANTTGQPPIP